MTSLLLRDLGLFIAAVTGFFSLIGSIRSFHQSKKNEKSFAQMRIDINGKFEDYLRAAREQGIAEGKLIGRTEGREQERVRRDAERERERERE